MLAPALLVLILAALAAAPPARSASAAAGQQAGLLLPNLRQELPAQLALRSEPRGRRVLRFSATTINTGAGPLVVEGRREGRRMRADQLVVRSDGTWLRRRRAGVLRYRGTPDHAHWHLEGFASFRLSALHRTRRRRGHKAGFCLGDRRLAALPAPLTSSPPSFTGDCGLLKPALDVLIQGISRGYADPYEAFLPGQEIHVGGLPAGRYVLTQTADPHRRLAEERHDDNSSSLLLRLRPRARGAAALRVLRACEGAPWCPPTDARAWSG